ncbi:MAG: hypothetical protein V7L05_06540 [Nostoc sp.]
MVTSSPCPMPHSPCPKTPSPCGWSFSYPRSFGGVGWGERVCSSCVKAIVKLGYSVFTLILTRSRPLGQVNSSKY